MIRLIQPGETGADFSYSKPPPARLVELGFDFVVGYISPNPKKNLLNPLDYINAGLGVLFVYEVAATTPNGGRARGLIDGADAKRQLEALGQPYDVPFLIAFDTNTTPANLAAHIAYFNAFAEVCAPYFAGAYMDTDLAAVVDEVIGWLPLAWSWSGRSKADAEAKARALGYHVLQGHGYWIDNQWAVDPNIAIQPFPTWGIPREAPKQPIIKEEEDMTAVVTNAESREWQGIVYPPKVLKYILQDDDRPKRASGGVLLARGVVSTLSAINADLGTPWTNADFADAGGEWTPSAVVIPPIVIPDIVIPPFKFTISG